MRVIRPRTLTVVERRRAAIQAVAMLAVGVLGAQLTLVAAATPPAAAAFGATGAMGLGIGAAWLVRVVRPERGRDLPTALLDILSPAFDDTYTLVVAPRLPVRDAARLDAILVGPGGVRVLTARDWHGRYRVRQRIWEFDARGRRGWIRCRTNPSYDAVALATGVARWVSDRGIPEVPLKAAVVFPLGHSRVVLEEPMDEVVTADNAPWWANAIGRVKRLDDGLATRLVTAVIEESERDDDASRVSVARRAV